MALLIDTPRWPAYGRLWAHLVSDTALGELHAFANKVGIPQRSFEGDHYDVPAERHAAVVAAGARWVEGRDVVKALQRSGSRLPKRRGERVLGSWPQTTWPAGAGHRVDCVASTLEPVGTCLARWLIALDDEGRLAVDGHRLPLARGSEPRLGYLRLRPQRPGAGWLHVAIHHERGTPTPSTYVPPHLVDAVEAQELWWPLLLLALERAP